MWRVQGWVTAMLYCWLAPSHRSLWRILPITLTSTLTRAHVCNLIPSMTIPSRTLLYVPSQNHSYYLSFNDCWNSCIQFDFSSMYLCFYIATHQHMGYLDWLQAVLESNSWGARTWKSSGLRDPSRGGDQAGLVMQLEIEIERTQRCTRRLWSTEFGAALGGCDWVNWGMQLEAEVEWTQRCTLRPWLNELLDAIGDQEWVHSEMCLEAVIELDYNYTGRMWSIEFGDAIGDRDWVNSEINCNAVIEWVWTCTCSRLWLSDVGGVVGRGRCGGGQLEAFQVVRLLTLVS